MKKWLRLILITASALCASAPAAFAIEDGNPVASCIEVEVNGERAPSFSCLTQKLSPRTDDARQPVAALPSEAITQRPSNQLDLFNRSATSERMGNTFGTSVYPQRPDNPIPASPIIPRASR